MNLWRSVCFHGGWLLGLGSVVLRADEPKNHDFDVIREESKVPAYQLPAALVSAEGRPITTPEELFRIRRPQLISIFCNLIYGVVPNPETPVQTSVELLKTNRSFMGDKSVRKDVRLRFHNTQRDAELRIRVFTPQAAGKPSPVFLLHSFSGTRDAGHDANPGQEGPRLADAALRSGAHSPTATSPATTDPVAIRWTCTTG